MKYSIIFIIHLLIASSSFGDENSDISTLVSKIKTAKSSEKRVLINELKVRLRHMNQETKNDVMSQLRKSNNIQNTNSKHMYQNTNSKHIQQNRPKNTNMQKQQNGFSQRKGKR